MQIAELQVRLSISTVLQSPPSTMYYRLYYAAAAVLCMRWGASNHSIVVIYRPGIAWPFFYLRSTDFVEKERKRRLDIYFLLLSFFLCLQDDADSRVARIQESTSFLFYSEKNKKSILEMFFSLFKSVFCINFSYAFISHTPGYKQAARASTICEQGKNSEGLLIFFHI